MLRDFPPGSLVRWTLPDWTHVPKGERRVGIVLGHVPPGSPGNVCAITQLLVQWSGRSPQSVEKFTIEPDHRLDHV